jgi:hypothetical protein
VKEIEGNEVKITETWPKKALKVLFDESNVDN